MRLGKAWGPLVLQTLQGALDERRRCHLDQGENAINWAKWWKNIGKRASECKRTLTRPRVTGVVCRTCADKHVRICWPEVWQMPSRVTEALHRCEWNDFRLKDTSYSSGWVISAGHWRFMPFFCFFAGCHKTTCWRSGQNANRNRTVKQRREVWWVRCQAYMDLSDAEKISVRLAGRKSTGKHQEIRWNASQHFMFAQTFSQAMWLTPGCFSWIPWEQLLSTMVQRVLYTLYTVRSKTPWATYERIVDRNGFNMSTRPFPTNSLYYLGRVPKCPVRGSLQVSLLLAKLLLSCTDLHHKPYRAYTWNAAQLPQAEVHRRFLERVDSWNLWCLCLRICEHEKTRPKPNRTLYTWLRSMTQCSCTMFIDIQWHADTEW